MYLVLLLRTLFFICSTKRSISISYTLTSNDNLVTILVIKEDTKNNLTKFNNLTGIIHCLNGKCVSMGNAEYNTLGADNTCIYWRILLYFTEVSNKGYLSNWRTLGQYLLNYLRIWYLRAFVAWNWYVCRFKCAIKVYRIHVSLCKNADTTWHLFVHRDTRIAPDTK